MIIGSIIGDIIGSTYEFVPNKSKRFRLFPANSSYTDDTVMTIAVTRALMEYKLEAKERLPNLMEKHMRMLGRQYPRAGYGTGFSIWLRSNHPEPYNSFGNGSAMRAAPCGIIAQSLDEALSFAEASAIVTHNHPEGIKGAQAVAAAVFLAKSGASKDEIGGFICDHFYPLTKSLDEIRPSYWHNETCQGSVPESIIAFLESDNYEDAIRNAVSLGGDADTMACICGGIAWAYYTAQNQGYPTAEMIKLAQRACQYLPDELLKTIKSIGPGDEFLIRHEAIQFLENAEVIDSTYCRVQGTRIEISRKDILLDALRKDEDSLDLPMALFFTSPFWRRLKALSNQRRDTFSSAS